MSEWKEYKFTEVATLTNGRAYLQPELQSTGKYKIVRVGNLSGGDKWFYSDMELPVDKYCNKGDLLYAWACSFGPYIWEGDKTIYHYHIWKVDVNTDVADKFFLYYYLKYYTPKWMGLTNGSVMMHITKGSLEKQTIHLPPIETQKSIASILSSLDDKIAVNRRICENLEAQAQALFKHWFIDFAPFKNGKFVESELGMIPEGWRVGTLGEYIQVKRGGSPRPIQKYLSKEGMNWLKISDATASDSPFIMSIKEKIIEEGLNHTIFRNAGSLVLSNSATPCIPKFLGVDTCIHDGWLYFPNSQLSNEYLYLFFQRMRKSLLLKANGSVFLNLKTDIVKSQSFVCPTQKIMEDFDRIITHPFKTIFNLTQESSRLSTLRDALLPKLMSGQIKV